MRVKNYGIFLAVIALVMFGYMYFDSDFPLGVSDHYRLSLLGSPPRTLDQVHRFRLEVKLENGNRVYMGFHDRDSQEPEDNVALVIRSVDNSPQRTTGSEAEKEIDELVRRLPHPNRRQPLTVIETTLAHLNINEIEVREFELAMYVTNGEVFRVDLEYATSS